MQELLISSIRTDGTQARVTIDREYVKELAEVIKAGTRLPPVEVYRDGKDIWLSDGHHRIQATAEAGKKTIRCEVHKGGLKEAKLAAIGANTKHGKRRTNDDKRNAVKMAFDTVPEWSDERIADHAGVSRQFVFGLRKAQPQVVNRLQPETRIGQDGKAYPARRIPPPPPSSGRATPPPPPPAERRSIPPPPVVTPAEKQACREAATGRKDPVGRSIPDHLWPLFDRAEEVGELLRAISKVKGTIQTATDDGDPLFADCAAQQTVAALETAYAGIKATLPIYVCPWCGGTLSRDCAGCSGRGALGEFRWRTVPEEMRKA